MKRIASIAGTVLISGSLLTAGPAAATPAGSQVPAPGTVGTSSPASSVTQQDSGDLNVDGARVNNNATQGTLKSIAVDGQVNTSGTQGQVKSAATDGTETQSQLAAPQFKAMPASSS